MKVSTVQTRCVFCFQYLSTSRKGKIRTLVHRITVVGYCSPVIDKLPMDDIFTEDVGREYFIDLVLGLEYCKQVFLVV